MDSREKSASPGSVEAQEFDSRILRITVLLYNADENLDQIVERVRSDNDFRAVAISRKYTKERQEFIAKLLVKTVRAQRAASSFEEIRLGVKKIFRMYAPPHKSSV